MILSQSATECDETLTAGGLRKGHERDGYSMMPRSDHGNIMMPTRGNGNSN